MRSRSSDRQSKLGSRTVGVRRTGMVLVLVLVVVALLTLAGLTFSELMLTEHKAARMHARQAQARALAESGVEKIQQFLMQTPDEQTEAGGKYDNPDHFRGLLVIDDPTPRGRGRFTVVSPYIEAGELVGQRFGLEDESARLNLNTLLVVDQQIEGSGRQLLLGLPGMTPDIADAILDWMDPDDEPREFGAELDYYSDLEPAYAPANGPFTTIEELLLVRGVTPEYLFGADMNRNGMIDASEQQQALLASSFDADPEVDRGWGAYLTLYSMEGNLQPDGNARINLNEQDLTKLHEELSAVFNTEWANFIVAYRQNGPAREGDDQRGQSASSIEVDLEAQARFTFATVLDLIGSRTQIPGEDEDDATIIETPFPDIPLAMGAYLPLLMDHVTVNPAPAIPGRININQASRVVLKGIPGISEETVEEIISRREAEYTGENPGRRHETWLLSEEVVTLEEMKALMPFINAGGNVFRAQVVGYFEEDGPAARIEVIIDATKSTPRQLFWRNLSHLGRGYRLDTLGLEVRQ